jgi:hypothetical protein
MHIRKLMKRTQTKGDDMRQDGWTAITPDTLPERDRCVELLMAGKVQASCPKVIHRYSALYGSAETLRWRYVDCDVMEDHSHLQLN